MFENTEEMKDTMRTVGLWSTASLVGATVIFSIAHYIGRRKV
jgi:hypothetical protein